MLMWMVDALFYDVYTHVSELHLRQLGLSVEWSDVYVQEQGEDTWGQTRSYFNVPLYKLPVVTMTSGARAMS
jgi:protein arginine N-methyltransferase 2